MGCGQEMSKYKENVLNAEGYMSLSQHIGQSVRYKIS